MLKTKKVIVTGAASGIGKEIVKQCLHEGVSVIACDINEHSLYELKESMANHYVLHTYQLDVSNYEEVAKFFEHVEEAHTDVDGLVNNAGVYLAKNILDYQVDEMDKVLDINVKGFIYFSQMFGKKLLQSKRPGVIVNMSSVSGMEGSSDAIYGLSKAAILGLTKSCALNFSPYIRVNAVAPTMVTTPMMDTIPDWRKENYLKQQLIHTPVLPVDVADTVVFLLSDRAKHYTGATFDINNGGYLR
ncbi:SDR family oxidoreductase [Cytobacillus sp. FSL W7-1323]|uniref:3-ketoacyl-ACP reductase n=1 Tax=Cytobacillus kochii TaxID=859143 RepID=A0A248TH28_9BACI|nr:MULTISPECIES: SDR family oxidoreductase [Cytobacillus]ASV67517.1 3-ketoacyl-ACP reductase [Cytobacillus kochii]MDQ0186271.1 3-oxoacyl-[acyl-carrier protein] reductase [Cytobacillus kochii]MEA1855656.1 SDR family oxidoreductase [Cytobacillus sp. OWB-43]